MISLHETEVAIALDCDIYLSVLRA